MVLLGPDVTVFVHPIDTAAHPTIPPGWRWAVVLGGQPPSNVDATANAGWCPSEAEACLEGEQVGVTAAKALRAFGIPVSYALRQLTYDPIPSGADKISIGG